MKFPSLKTFIRALWKFLGRPELAPLGVVEVRRARCQLCPHNENGQCQKCTCFIGLKTMFSTESCPDRRWSEYYNKNRHGL